MNFTEAARLKRFVQKNFSVNLHIHDTCGGLYVSIDEPHEAVREYIVSFCKEAGIAVTVSSDGTQFFPADRHKPFSPEDKAVQDRFFDISEDLDIVFVPAGKRATAYVNKKEVGYCTYYERAGIWVIDHTVVEELWQDKGIAGKLVERIVTEAKKRGIAVEAECSFAVRWLSQ